jgi:hypothetical protein
MIPSDAAEETKEILKKLVEVENIFSISLIKYG